MNTQAHMVRVAARMRLNAKQYPWDGKVDRRGMAILSRCRESDLRTGAGILFTLDHGYHLGGWWKNPDYERCYHLSISSLAEVFDDAGMDSEAAGVPELTPATREAWARAFSGDSVRLVWCEPPGTDHGRTGKVWHYRLFIDESGIPLLPRGEVYSRELTEAGWKSWSELHEEEA